MSLVPSSRVPFSTRGLRRGSGALVAAALSLTGFGCATATATAVATDTAPVTAAPVTTDPNTFVDHTGAPGYADPTTPALRTVRVSTSAQLTAALSGAVPGDAILLAAGTYSGPFSVSRSGTRAHPVVLQPAVGAAVTLRASIPYPSCAAVGPDENRTLAFSAGVSHWVVKGLTINGGLKISGENSSKVTKWQIPLMDRGEWQTRRQVPGSSAYDPSKTSGIPAFFTRLLGSTITGAEDVQILDSTITGKGIFGRLARYAVFSGNTITQIACGTGPGIWLSNFSHGNVVTGNDVSDIAHATDKPFMQEGIRLGNGSDYNVVTGNVVHDLAVGGRGMTTDQDSSFNLFTRNTADTVDIGFSEEQSGWGNIWTYNAVRNARVASYGIRMMDAPFDAPSKNSSSYNITMSCNTSTGSLLDFQAGAVAQGTFAGNRFSTFKVNDRLAGYWGSVGDTWNGVPTAPQTGNVPIGTSRC